MLTSKFDLYRTEWLDLVFDDRNKSYGAYQLRRTYAPTMVKAMGITFFAVAALCGGYIIANTKASGVTEHHTKIDLTDDNKLIVPVKEVQLPKPRRLARPQRVTPSTATKVFVPMVVTSGPVTTDPPKTADLGGNISSSASGSTNTAGPAAPDVTTSSKDGGPTAMDETITDFSGLEVMPQPMGGMEAWAKFLTQNLRFPSEAQQDGVSGKVFLSFIIEKDGHLSDITVARAAGHGFDEEALRVLKLAKAWKPGMQNGRPVRVKYTIPINFQAP